MKPSSLRFFAAVLLPLGIPLLVWQIHAWSVPHSIGCGAPGSSMRARLEQEDVRAALSIMHAELESGAVTRDRLESSWPTYFVDGFAERTHMELSWDAAGRPILTWAGYDRVPANGDDRVARFGRMDEVVVVPLARY